MREIFTYGSVGGAAGQPPLLPGAWTLTSGDDLRQIVFILSVLLLKVLFRY